jgi:hypothetical protein
MQDFGGWGWFLMEVVGVVILGVGLVYGMMMWRARPKDPATKEVRDEATDRLYHKR